MVRAPSGARRGRRELTLVFALLAVVGEVCAHASHAAERRLPGARHSVDALVARRAAFAADVAALGAPADASAASGIALAVSPPLLTSDVQNVTVSWTGFAGANASSDWVGQVCVGYPMETYLEWAKIDECATYSTGACAMTFTVFRARCAYEFRIFRGKQPIWPTGVVLATSNAFSWAGDADAPYHVHSAFGGEDTQHSAIVSFSTNTSAAVVVMVGRQSGVYDLPNASDVESTTYGPDDLCNAPANTTDPFFWQWPGYFHHVTLHGLEPGTRYFARPVTDGVHFGPEASFQTGFALGAEVPVSFAAFGDMSVTQWDYDEDGVPADGFGAVGTQRRVRELIDSGDVTFVTHFGDLGYAKGYVGMWDCWMAMMSVMGSRAQYMVSMGNHEYDYRFPSPNDPSGQSGGVHADMPPWFDGDVDSLGECGVGTAQRFRAPLGGNLCFWYSFSTGSVTVVMLSSEHRSEPDSPQGQWLARTLAAVNRTLTPWLVVTQHRHMYLMSLVEEEVQRGYIANLEPLFLKYSVDLVLTGHTHDTARSCAIVNWTCQEGGPVYITSGSSGALLEDYPPEPSLADRVRFYNGASTGFSVISALNSSHLRVRWVKNADASIADEAFIVKAATARPGA